MPLLHKRRDYQKNKLYLEKQNKLIIKVYGLYLFIVETDGLKMFGLN